MSEALFNGAHDEDYEPGQPPKHVKGWSVPRAASEAAVAAKLARIVDGVVERHREKMADLRR